MAGMQRFVTYIYAYEDGQKNGNAGYAKIETRGSNGRMDINFASPSVSRGNGKVSFLYIEDGKLVLVPLGEFPIENGRGMGLYTFKPETMLDTKLKFEKMDGIHVVDSNNLVYMSFWKDVELADFAKSEIIQYEESLDELDVSEAEDENIEMTKSSQQEMIEDAEQESLHTMEIPMHNVFPDYTMQEIWGNLEKSRNCVQINEDVCAVQLELSDLRELPRQHWNLGNNSFLLHGFFNYRHLLLGKLSNGKWFIGVPGVYQAQEQVMASIFGFPGFLVTEDQQGIWYHILED